MGGACQEYLRGARAGLSFWCVGLYATQALMLPVVGLGGAIYSVVHACLGAIVLAMSIELEDLKGIPFGAKMSQLLQTAKGITERRIGKFMKRPKYYGALAFYLGLASISRAFKERQGNFSDDIWVGYVFLSFVTFWISLVAWFLGCCCGSCYRCCCAGDDDEKTGKEKESKEKTEAAESNKKEE
mmetsp:Transcript_17607/g.39868  ORF Transcript_17607/g.39868 Transcript_17607/m.39868 type:complete len:185 (-) Transcript_17607:105-659(-)